MKYAFAAVALAAIAQAQTLADIPECAIPCLDKSIGDNTDCKVTDLACVCENFDAVQGDATACVLKECGSAVAINDVLPAAEKLCENPPAAGGEETTSAAAEPTVSEPAEEASSSDYPEETKPAEETKPVVTPAPMPTIETPLPIPEPTEVVPPTTEEPEATPVPTAAASAFGPMGGLAMLVLGAFAL